MRRFWAILFGILLLLAVAHIGWTASLKSAFEERLEAVRASGAPIELADLNRDPVPPSLDAAPLLRRATGRLRSNPNPADLAWYSLIVNDPVEEADLAAARQWTTRMEPVFDWLKDAAGKPSWSFGVDWTHGIETEVESIPAMQATVDYLKWRAYFAESPEDATECATVLFDLARKLERPSAISCLVRWTVENEACDILERCARKFGIVGHLGGRLAAAEDPRGAIEALEGERAMCLSLVLAWARGETSPLRMIRKAGNPHEDPGRTPADLLATSPLCRPFAYGDGSRALEMFDEALALNELEPWEALRKADGFDAQHAHGVPWIHSSLYRVLPEELAVRRCRHLATLRVTDAGLAVLDWRRERGEWPATLADVGEWVDPFTGNPLIYDMDDDGIRIEAAWWTPFADDEERIEFKRSEGEDIAWTLEAR
jgi:hypothetical protein